MSRDTTMLVTWNSAGSIWFRPAVTSPGGPVKHPAQGDLTLPAACRCLWEENILAPPSKAAEVERAITPNIPDSSSPENCIDHAERKVALTIPHMRPIWVLTSAVVFC